MKHLLSLLFALIVVSATHAQTVLPIPAATNPDFIDYAQKYCNLSVYDLPYTINGTPYEVSLGLHFTPGNPAATFGTIDFAYYPPNGGQVTVTSVPFSNITGTLGPYNGNSSFAATFAGAFNGSVVLNVDFFSSWRGRVITYRMPNSSITVD